MGPKLGQTRVRGGTFLIAPCDAKQNPDLLWGLHLSVLTLIPSTTPSADGIGKWGKT